MRRIGPISALLLVVVLISGCIENDGELEEDDDHNVFIKPDGEGEEPDSNDNTDPSGNDDDPSNHIVGSVIWNNDIVSIEYMGELYLFYEVQHKWEKQEVPTLLNLTYTIELIRWNGNEILDQRIITKVNYSMKGDLKVFIYKDQLILTWLDNKIGNVVKTFDGCDWSEDICFSSGQKLHPGFFNILIGEMIIFNDTFYLFWTEKGVNEIFYVMFDGKSWSTLHTVGANLSDWNTPLVERRYPYPPLIFPKPFDLNGILYLLTATEDRLIPIEFNGTNWTEKENLFVDVEVYRSVTIEYNDEICVISKKRDYYDPLCRNGSVFLDRFDGKNWTEQLVLSKGLEDIPYETDVHIPPQCQIIDGKLVVIWRSSEIVDNSNLPFRSTCHSNVWDGERLGNMTDVNISYIADIDVMNDVMYIFDYFADNVHFFDGEIWSNNTLPHKNDIRDVTNFDGKFVMLKEIRFYGIHIIIVDHEDLSYSYFQMNTTLTKNGYEKLFLG